MNYQRIYNNLINNAKHRKSVSDYIENHHIIPISIGGTNDTSNIVSLTYREHFLAHYLLTKITSGKKRVSMLFAFGLMSCFSKSNSYRKNVNSKMFSKSKEAANLAKLELVKLPGYVSHIKGRKWFTDGEKKFRLHPNDPLIKISNLTPTHGAAKGKVWFSDGINFYMLSESDGLIKGYIKKSPNNGKPKNFSQKVKDQRSQMLWFNDGIKSTKLNPSDLRTKGLKRGRLKFKDEALQNIKTGCKNRKITIKHSAWQLGTKIYNDGIKHYRFREGELIPDHLLKGRIRRHHQE